MIIYTFKIPKNDVMKPLREFNTINEINSDFDVSHETLDHDMYDEHDMQDGVIISDSKIMITDMTKHEKCLCDSKFCDFYQCIDSVHTNPPDTWENYSRTIDDLFKIINMEFIEVNTDLQNKNYENCKTNLCHLACACGCLYNLLK